MKDSPFPELESWLIQLEDEELDADTLQQLEARIDEDPAVADYVAQRMLLIEQIGRLDRKSLDAGYEKIVPISVDGPAPARRGRGWAIAGVAAAIAIGFGVFALRPPIAVSPVVVGTEPPREMDAPGEFVPITNRGSLNHPELVGTTLAAADLAATLPDVVDYNDHVRPILNQKCLACHGGVKKSGGLSFLFPDEALAEAKSGARAIVPGDTAESEMIYRITADADDSDLMPPADHHDRLSDEEVALIDRWIAQGAKFSDHWAFLPLPEATEPATIDQHILAELDRREITPAPRADRYAQLRRLSLDLTGVPPTPEEIAHFIGNESPDAWEQEVDRLLASPRYGERWAGMWLDIARYSDTKGYEKDSPRDVWPYRDWLIDAFNNDLPYDQFLTHQLAGDLLENPTHEQLIATAFHRNTMNNTEGGTNDEEFRIAAVIDRVNTTFEALSGVTMNCVQCHSHPYDPIRMEEFYSVMAFFNNASDADRDDDRPVLKTYPREKADEYRQLASDYRGTEAEILVADATRAETMALWGKNLRDLYDRSFQPITEHTITSTEGTAYTIDDVGIATADAAPAASERLRIQLPPVSESTTLDALKLTLLPHAADQLSYAEGGRVVINSMHLYRTRDGKRVRLPFHSGDTNVGEASYELSNVLNHKGNKEIVSAWKIALPEDGTPPWAVLTLEKPLHIQPGDQLEFHLNHAYANARDEVTARFQLATATDTRFAQRRKFTYPVMAQALPQLRVPQDRFFEPVLVTLLKAGVLSHPQSQQLLDTHAAMVALETQPVIVTTDVKDRYRRETRLFIGGNWMNPGDAYEPRPPAAIAPWSDDYPPNRLGLAQWMTSRDNALTARVAVNRFWEQLFGEGLVITVEDLGTMGAKPTYRALLDDLALQFKTDHDWSMKALLKTIVLSEAYRRSSDTTPELLAADQANHYLSRGPRFRLRAEQVRDQALHVSGLLSDKRYGPPVMPHQPDGIWNSVYNGAKWETSPGEDQYRRAVYTYWKRSSPYPSMLAFDAGAREVCAPRRIQTNTPLQALVTLNDPVFVEAAAALGQRIAEAPGELEEKIAHGFLRTVSRPADAKDTDMLRSAWQDAIASGADEATAYTFVARILLNLDETLTKS